MRTQLLGARRLLPPSHPGFLVEKEQLDIPDSPLLTVGECDTMRWGTESNWREGSQYFLVHLPPLNIPGLTTLKQKAKTLFCLCFCYINTSLKSSWVGTTENAMKCHRHPLLYITKGKQFWLHPLMPFKLFAWFEILALDWKPQPVCSRSNNRGEPKSSWSLNPFL